MNLFKGNSCGTVFGIRLGEMIPERRDAVEINQGSSLRCGQGKLHHMKDKASIDTTLGYWTREDWGAYGVLC